MTRIPWGRHSRGPDGGAELEEQDGSSGPRGDEPGDQEGLTPSVRGERRRWPVTGPPLCCRSVARPRPPREGMACAP